MSWKQLNWHAFFVAFHTRTYQAYGNIRVKPKPCNYLNRGHKSKVNIFGQYPLLKFRKVYFLFFQMMKIYWVPLPSQLYFLISSFKYENNMKFLCAIIMWTTRLPFCIIKFKFVVRMRECLPRGTKVHSRASRARARDFSTPCTNSNL